MDQRLIDGVAALQGERSIAELGAERDRLLVELIEARRRSFLP